MRLTDSSRAYVFRGRFFIPGESIEAHTQLVASGSASSSMRDQTIEWVARAQDGAAPFHAEPGDRRFALDADAARFYLLTDVVEAHSTMTGERLWIVAVDKPTAMATRAGLAYVREQDGGIAIIDTNAGQLLARVREGRVGGEPQ